MSEQPGDLTAALLDRVRAASAAGTPLRIAGGDTKRFYGRPIDGDLLCVAPHHGILNHDPAELVLTARAGTPLAEIESLLEQHGQRLPFEPPAYGADATIGGTVAAGLAGPTRAARGPVRDYVLGTRLLTGDGRVLRFGGEVMKNVAGYDVSRLVVGSLGILGVVLDVSLKVLPRPPGACTLRYQYDAEEAVRWLASVVQRGVPVAASFWHAGELRVRLEASLQGLHALGRELGGERMEEHAASEGWSAVREQRLSCFRSAATLWRLHVPAPVSMPRGSLRETLSFEWNGAQRWMACDDEGAVRSYAGETGGSLTRFRSAGRLEPGVEVFDAVPDPVMRLHREVKRAFDPAGILNPGRLYWGL